MSAYVNLSDITSKILTVAGSLFGDKNVIEFLFMFMTCLCTKFQMPSSSCSVDIAIKPKTKSRFHAGAISLYSFHSYRNKSSLLRRIWEVPGWILGPGDRLYKLRFLWLYSVPSGECRDSALKLGHIRFLAKPFPIHHHSLILSSTLYSLLTEKTLLSKLPTNEGCTVFDDLFSHILYDRHVKWH
jgi:hypothetical protein